ncbi:unnamed protein product [Amoebophrya sp. A25]|nr:unnamed protein product [Amoebophrya sp. A25]|eukprot:GSA25T00026181001.1
MSDPEGDLDEAFSFMPFSRSSTEGQTPRQRLRRAPDSPNEAVPPSGSTRSSAKDVEGSGRLDATSTSVLSGSETNSKSRDTATTVLVGDSVASSSSSQQMVPNSQDGGLVLPRHFDSQRLTWSSRAAAENLYIPATKNHTGTLVGSDLYIFGGYDGGKNHNTLFVYNVDTHEWSQPNPGGLRPSGRNGHSATLIFGTQILILGGWLGNGPLAAGDVHILDTARFEWIQPDFEGEPPGPCNMHTSDLVGQDLVLVFRGGDGRAYLNDLHALDLKSRTWYPYRSTGQLPPPRANHSACVHKETLFVFGGWDGSKRLNDLYALDTTTQSWSYLRVSGQAPQARAGMSLSNVHGLLYLIGGSGHTTRCFNDCHIYDPKGNTWLEGQPLTCTSDDTGSESHAMEMKLQSRVSGGQQDPLPGINNTGLLRCTTNTCSQQALVPERRAGHACVVVGRRLFIFGGACGSQYFEKGVCYILDTDAAPLVSGDATTLAHTAGAAGMQNLLQKQSGAQLATYFDSEQFSDVLFTFHGTSRKIYAHRILLSIFSEHFRSMFSNNWREARENEVRLPPDIEYSVFRAILTFIYTGDIPELLSGSADVDAIGEKPPCGTSCTSSSKKEEQVHFLLRLLRAADEFCIDAIKLKCEQRLCQVVDASTVSLVLAEADRYGAHGLTRYCNWLLRQLHPASPPNSPSLID